MREPLSFSWDWSQLELTVHMSWAVLLTIVGLLALLLALGRNRVPWTPQKSGAKLKSVNVKLNLLGAEVDGMWEVDEHDRRAAWELYVELVTRTSVARLDRGILREALTSLHSLFDTTRKILRQYGPDVAKPQNPGSLSFGIVAVAVLNQVLRPVLTEWHPELQRHEAKRNPSVSVAEHEATWEKQEQLRGVLAEVTSALTAYAALLEDAAGVPTLLPVRKEASADAGR